MHACACVFHGQVQPNNNKSPEDTKYIIIKKIEREESVCVEGGEYQTGLVWVLRVEVMMVCASARAIVTSVR